MLQKWLRLEEVPHEITMDMEKVIPNFSEGERIQTKQISRVISFWKASNSGDQSWAT